MPAWLVATLPARLATPPCRQRPPAPAPPCMTCPPSHTASASPTAPLMQHHRAPRCPTSRTSPIHHRQTTALPLGCCIPRGAPSTSTVQAPMGTTLSMPTAAPHPPRYPTRPLPVVLRRVRWFRPTAPVRLRQQPAHPACCLRTAAPRRWPSPSNRSPRNWTRCT